MSLTYATPLILTDPGFLFIAALGSTEPTHAAAGSSYDADAWPVAWIASGPTEDGTDLSYESKVEPVRVAELFDPIRYSTTDRTGSIAFMLTNYTLKNLQRAYNGGTISTVSGSGATLSSKLIPPTPGNETRVMVGWESLDHTMRLVVYQAINGGTITSAFKRAPAKALIPFSFNMEIPASGTPFAVYGAGTGRLGT